MRVQVFRDYFRLSKSFQASKLTSSRTFTRCSSLHIEDDSRSDRDRKNQAESNSDISSNRDHNLASSMATKYKVFRDEDSPIIFDVEEELKRINVEEIQSREQEVNIFEGINLERGVNGVYEIDDLVNLLQRNNAADIFVTTVPKELAYVDYLVVVSGKSYKHMRATADMVRRVFKKKRHSEDILPKIEGKESKEWMAMDLGNIALHIFSEKARTTYDLETLWSVGSQYDDQSNRPMDEITELLEKHSYLAGYQPAEASN